MVEWKSKNKEDMRIDRFEDIEAWQLARELTQKVYCLMKKSSFAKDYGLKRQVLQYEDLSII